MREVSSNESESRAEEAGARGDTHSRSHAAVSEDTGQEGSLEGYSPENALSQKALRSSL